MNNFDEWLDAWALSHAHIILPLCYLGIMCLGIVLGAVVLSKVIGLSCTDSGMLRNFLVRGI